MRWNSALKMVERLTQQRAAIDKYALDKSDLTLTFIGTEWDQLTELIQGNRFWEGSDLYYIYIFSA